MENKNKPATIYEWVGGEDTIRRLVDAFYPKVLEHPMLRPIFPEDIDPVKEKQYMFLSQFFGGPALYTEQYGHPMMRARHLPFEITPDRADAWLDCMERAMIEIGLTEEERDLMLKRLRGPAYHFVNT